MPFPGAAVFPGPTSPDAALRDLTLTAELGPSRFTTTIQPGRFTATIGVDVPRHISITAGAVEYVVVTVTETAGADITDAAVLVSLGSGTAPGEWRTPDVITRPDPASVVVSLLVGDTFLPVAGRYFAWVQITDAPEQVPVRCTATSITIS